MEEPGIYFECTVNCSSDDIRLSRRSRACWSRVLATKSCCSITSLRDEAVKSLLDVSWASTIADGGSKCGSNAVDDREWVPRNNVSCNVRNVRLLPDDFRNLRQTLESTWKKRYIECKQPGCLFLHQISNDPQTRTVRTQGENDIPSAKASHKILSRKKDMGERQEDHRNNCRTVVVALAFWAKSCGPPNILRRRFKVQSSFPP